MTKRIVCLLAAIAWFFGGSLCFAEIRNKFEGSFSPKVSYDTNLFKDYRDLSVGVISSDLNLLMRTRFSRNTSSRLNYRLGLERYVDMDSETFEAKEENYYSHQLNGSLKQSLSEQFVFKLNAGGGLFQQPNYEDEREIDGSSVTIRYNSQNFFAAPEMEWHFLDHTIFTLGYSFDDIAYSDYDLDAVSKGFSFKISQDLSFSSYLDISARIQTKDYSERKIYASTNTTTNEKRQDKIIDIRASFTKNISRDLRFSITPSYKKNDSNSNWPDTYRKDSSTLLKLLIPDFYDYQRVGTAIRIDRKLRKGIQLGITGSYYRTEYAERLAKVEYFYYEKPIVKRLDQKIILSMTLNKNIGKSARLKFGYAYQSNSSNDYTYDTVSHKLSSGIMIWF